MHNGGLRFTGEIFLGDVNLSRLGIMNADFGGSW